VRRGLGTQPKLTKEALEPRGGLKLVMVSNGMKRALASRLMLG
jgi:hypothetical protein